jgi:hypothetical protein
VVPAGPDLVHEEHGLTARSGAGLQPGGLKLHQCQQTQRLGVVGRQAGQHAAQPQRLVDAHRSVRIHESPLVAEDPSLKTR